MKKLIFSIIFLLIATYVIAQHNFTLSGTITNPANDHVMLRIPNPLFPFLPGLTPAEPLDEQNSFSMELILEEPTYATFSHGREITKLYLEPGKAVTLSLDTEEFDESLHFEGSGSAANNFLAAYFLKFLDGNQAQEKMKSLEPTAFRAYADAKKEEKKAFLEAQKEGLSAEFMSWMTSKIDYEWGNELRKYPMLYAHYNKIKKPDLPKNYYSFGKELALDRKDLLSLDEYQQYMYHRINELYVEETSSMAVPPSKTAYINGQYDFAAKHLGGETLGFFRHKLLYEGMRYRGVEVYEQAYKRFLATTKVPEYRKSLEETYNQMAHLTAGNMAPAFTLPKLEGGELSMEELKGKVVYIDFWASWCGPCIGEMPSAKKVKEHFKDQSDLAFVYISLDDDEDSWRTMVEKQEIEGIHLLSKGWKSEAAEAYAIQGIPRYVLLNKKGQIIDAQMSRPSDANTITRIEEALATNNENCIQFNKPILVGPK